MNLAYRDVRHNLLRFVLTNFGLSLLLGIVIVITGVYGGLVDDALRQSRQRTLIFGWLIWHQWTIRRVSLSYTRRYREFVAESTASSAPRRYLQTVQTELNGNPLRVFLIGYELDRPGGPRRLIAGRNIIRSHSEIVVDRSAGLALGQEIPLGTHGHKSRSSASCVMRLLRPVTLSPM